MPNKNKGINLQKVLVIISKTLGSLVILGVILVLIPLSLPRLLGYETFDIISESMEPEIPVGSLVLVKRTDCDSLKKGEIIAFYHNGTVVCHRIVLNNYFEEKITTKGDANQNVDIEDVEYNEVIGVIKYHYPLLGTLGSYFSTASGKLLLAELIVCATLLFVVSDKVKLWLVNSS